MTESQLFHKLWDWVYAQPIGEYKIDKIVSPQTKEAFMELLKHFIRVDEFRVFNFYIELSDDYTKILKKNYPHNQMEYLERPKQVIEK